MNKTERQETVESLTEQLRASPNLYITDFTGLNVLRMTEFRRRLRAAGVSYVVVKNTLAQRALAANSVAGLDDHLAGPTGLVLAGNDPVGAAKVLTDFAREFEKPTIKIGLVDGRLVSPDQVKRRTRTHRCAQDVRVEAVHAIRGRARVSTRRSLGSRRRPA